MKLKNLITASLLALPLSFFTGSASAAAVTGISNIAGNVSVTATNINFAPTFTSTGPGATETGSFAGLTGGTIQSLTGGPITGSVFVPNFIMFNQGVSPTVNFDLTYIAPGVGTLAGCSSSTPGASCTPAGSPFTLFQLTSSTVIASLQLNGDAYIQPKSSGFSSTTGIFTTQVAANGTIPQVLAQLASTGVVGASYSATFVATPNAATPEPASMLLMGVGLVGAGLIARRRKAA